MSLLNILLFILDILFLAFRNNTLRRLSSSGTTDTIVIILMSPVQPPDLHCHLSSHILIVLHHCVILYMSSYSPPSHSSDMFRISSAIIYTQLVCSVVLLPCASSLCFIQLLSFLLLCLSLHPIVIQAVVFLR